ncbi:MAG: hypothetical protein ABI068_09605 [Ktedonobacterales bacterium]
MALLPLRFAWFLFYLLRLRASQGAEFEADRAAVQAYGTPAFINALTGVGVTTNTLRGSRSSLRQEMAKHNNQNFYAELRRHYSELPPEYISHLRLKAAQDFRDIESTHPSTLDRLRAAAMLNAPTPSLSTAPRPAYELLTPADASDASRTEIEMTGVLFGGWKRRR